MGFDLYDDTGAHYRCSFWSNIWYMIGYLQLFEKEPLFNSFEMEEGYTNNGFYISEYKKDKLLHLLEKTLKNRNIHLFIAFHIKKENEIKEKNFKIQKEISSLLQEEPKNLKKIQNLQKQVQGIDKFSLNEEDIKEFIDFLKESSGFRIL